MTHITVTDLWNDIEQEIISPEDVDSEMLPEKEETLEVFIHSAEAEKGGRHDLNQAYDFGATNSEVETKRDLGDLE